MKLTKEHIKTLKQFINNRNIAIDYRFKCDLCGYSFEAEHKSDTMKANCINCNNEVYTDAFDSIL